jgi:predicted alpha/beta superfamily hydrolase
MRLLEIVSLKNEERKMTTNPNINPNIIDKKDKYLVIHYHDKWAVFDELREKVLAVLDSSEMANETALMFARVEHRRAVLFNDAA